MMNYSHKSLLKSFSASPEAYVALPTGSGCTGAIEKAIRMLKSVETPQNKPDVFLSPYEHHSNILPWIEFYDSVKVLEFDSDEDVLNMEKI
jgi:selenocysteine lyase/cysteine desulfurase